MTGEPERKARSADTVGRAGLTLPEADDDDPRDLVTRPEIAARLGYSGRSLATVLMPGRGVPPIARRGGAYLYDWADVAKSVPTVGLAPGGAPPLKYCPYCGAGPLRNVLLHVPAHGVTPAECRAALRLGPTAAVADQATRRMASQAAAGSDRADRRAQTAGFASILDAVAQTAGMSQAAAARRVGVSVPTLAKYRNVAAGRAAATPDRAEPLPGAAVRPLRPAPPEGRPRRVGDPDGYGRFGVLDAEDGRLLCHECGQVWLHLATHSRQAHGLSAAGYREAHGLGASTPLVGRATQAKMRDRYEAHRDLHVAALEASRDPDAARAAQAPSGEGRWAPATRAKRASLAAARRGRPLTHEEADWLDDAGVDLQVWADRARVLLAAADVSLTSVADVAGITPATVGQRMRRYPPQQSPA